MARPRTFDAVETIEDICLLFRVNAEAGSDDTHDALLKASAEANAELFLL